MWWKAIHLGLAVLIQPWWTTRDPTLCARKKEGEIGSSTVRQFRVSVGVFWLERIANTNHLVKPRLPSFDLRGTTPFYRSKATGQMIGASFSAWEPTITGERADQLLEWSELPSRVILGGLSGGYVAEGIDRLPLSSLRSPATPSWPPPGARVNPPRGTFCSVLERVGYDEARTSADRE